jgi:hypothetical protein
MEGHVERRIGGAGGVQHEIDRRIHAAKIDAEVLQLVVKADRQQAMGAFADGAGREQGQRGRGVGIQ